MSTQSILEINKGNLLQDYEEKLLHYADAFFVKEKFLVGEGVDLDRIQHTMNFHDLLCTDNCEMSGYIQAKIEGEVGCKSERLCDAIKEYKGCSIDKHNHTDCEVMAECCDISTIGKTDW